MECQFCGKPLKRKGKYCNNTCQFEMEHKIYIKEWLLGNRDGKRGHGVSAHIHRYMREVYGEACNLCGWNKRHPITNNVPIELDHINGKWDDNRLENLRLLCPNCHSLTPTYRNLNAGNGDPNRYLNKSKLERSSTKVYFCRNCETELKGKGSLCPACSSQARRKFLISKEALEHLVSTLPMLKVGKILGVSDSAVRKRCSVLGISKAIFYRQHKSSLKDN